MLSLLGLRYGAVSLALQAIGVLMSKTHVYETVQEAAKRVPGLKREQVFQAVRPPALGADLTSVKCKGIWLPLAITVDPISGVADDALMRCLAKTCRRSKTGSSPLHSRSVLSFWSPRMPMASRRSPMRWAWSTKSVKRTCSATPTR